MIPGITNMCEN